MASHYDISVFTEGTAGNGHGCVAGTDGASDGPRETIGLQPRPIVSFVVESPVGDKGLPPVFLVWTRVDVYDPADAAAVRAMRPKLLRYLPDGSPVVLTVTTRREARPCVAGVPKLAAHPG
jgi:hypothetical protein